MTYPIRPIVAIALLSFAGASFAQDDVEEESGGWFSGISSFFSNLFSSDDSSAVDAVAESDSGGTFSGIEWYGGADGGVTKYSSGELRVSRITYGAYAGGILSNRVGFELGYLDLGEADVQGSPGTTLASDGYRGMLTYSTEAGDAPVRIGLGYYSIDSAINAGKSESSSGLTVGIKFEQAITENVYMTMGTDLLFGGKRGGEKSDAIMFGIGLAFHTSRPLPAAEAEDDGIGVTEPAYEETSYEEPAYEEPAYESPVTEDSMYETPMDETPYDDSADDSVTEEESYE